MASIGPSGDVGDHRGFDRMKRLPKALAKVDQHPGQILQCYAAAVDKTRGETEISDLARKPCTKAGHENDARV